MAARVFSGAVVPAADAARAHLVGKIETLARAGLLALPAQAAAELASSTAHAAALLHVAGAAPPAPRGDRRAASRRAGHFREAEGQEA